MKKFAIILGAAAVLATRPLSAIEVQGVNVPATETVSGRELKLNGAGVRSATVLRVKVYVASFYAPEPLGSEKEVMASKGPLKFNFTFLRGFPKEKVTQAWEWQFEQSGDHPYPDFQKDKARFISAFGALKKFGVETVEIEGDTVRVIDQGELRETIVSKDFKKIFLSLWFGQKPVQASLKDALLGKRGS